MIKKRLQRMCFPINIAYFSRTPILKNHLRTAVPVNVNHGLIHVSKANSKLIIAHLSAVFMLRLL